MLGPHGRAHAILRMYVFLRANQLEDGRKAPNTPRSQPLPDSQGSSREIGSDERLGLQPD